MLNSQEIMARAPFRSPIFFVDRVEEEEFPTIKGYKNITINEPYFAGHFAGKPIMPGVLQLEALFELCWLLYSGREERAPQLELRQLKRIKFRHPVRPGDRLDLEARELERQGDEVWVAVRSSIAGETACEGQFLLQLR